MIDLYSSEFHLLCTPFERRDTKAWRFNGERIVRWQGRLIDPLGEHQNFRNKNQSYESQSTTYPTILSKPNHRPPLFINTAVNIGYHVNSNSKLSSSWATPKGKKNFFTSKKILFTLDEKLFNFANFHLLLLDNNRHWHFDRTGISQIPVENFSNFTLSTARKRSPRKEKIVSLPFDSIPLYPYKEEAAIFDSFEEQVRKV